MVFFRAKQRVIFCCWDIELLDWPLLFSRMGKQRSKIGEISKKMLKSNKENFSSKSQLTKISKKMESNKANFPPAAQDQKSVYVQNHWFQLPFFCRGGVIFGSFLEIIFSKFEVFFWEIAKTVVQKKFDN